MSKITIEPAGPRDLAMHSEQYEELRADLQGMGYEATIEPPFEQRGVDVLQSGFEIALHVGEILAADALLRLGVRIRRNLRGLSRPAGGGPRQAVIYGPNGEILSRVDLPVQGEEHGA